MLEYSNFEFFSQQKKCCCPEIVLCKHLRPLSLKYSFVSCIPISPRRLQREIVSVFVEAGAVTSSHIVLSCLKQVLCVYCLTL